MRREFAAYLWDMYEAGQAIERYTAGLDETAYSTLEEKQGAVERRFEIMGEAIAQCRKHYPSEVAQLGDVQGVIDFRNYLVHRYHLVASSVVWAIIQRDLPPLLSTIRALLPPVVKM